MRELLDVKGLAETSPPFKAKLIRIADELGLNAGYLAAVISFESMGTFSPSIPNMMGSGAMGLIQIMPDTAVILGTTTAALAKMTATQQLTYVALYYKGVGVSRIKTPLDYYMAVFSPAFIGKEYNTPMYSEGTKEYRDNKGLDADNDGIITVGDVASKFLAIIIRAEARPPILVDETEAPTSRGLFTGISVLAIAIGIYTLSKLTYHTSKVSYYES